MKPKNSPKNKKRSCFTWIANRISDFLPCEHEWEVLEVVSQSYDYSGFKYVMCRCGCKKCGAIEFRRYLA